MDAVHVPRRPRRSGGPAEGSREFHQAAAYLLTVRETHGDAASMACLADAARYAARRNGETHAHALSAFGDYAEGPVGPPPEVVRDAVAYLLAEKRSTG